MRAIAAARPSAVDYTLPVQIDGSWIWSTAQIIRPCSDTATRIEGLLLGAVLLTFKIQCYMQIHFILTLMQAEQVEPEPLLKIWWTSYSQWQLLIMIHDNPSLQNFREVMKSGNSPLHPGKLSILLQYEGKGITYIWNCNIEHTSTKMKNVINLVCAGKVGWRDPKNWWSAWKATMSASHPVVFQLVMHFYMCVFWAVLHYIWILTL